VPNELEGNSIILCPNSESSVIIHGSSQIRMECV